MDWIDALLLGALQGLTEYLPVSSSGHLVLARELIGVQEPNLLFDVVVHVATLVVTVVFYRGHLVAMVRESREAWTALLRSAEPTALRRRLPSARLALWVVVGTVPTGVIGLVFEDDLKALFVAPRLAAAMLFVTAVLLLASRLRRPVQRDQVAMTWVDAVIIGTVQGLAIIPGISRSGSTIAIGLLLGLDRELAARFSFLLSIPAILGALLVQFGDASSDRLADGSLLGIGFVSSLIAGFLALALVLPVVRRGRLHWFAVYLVPIAVAGWVLIP